MKRTFEALLPNETDWIASLSNSEFKLIGPIDTEDDEEFKGAIYWRDRNDQMLVLSQVAENQLMELLKIQPSFLRKIPAHLGQQVLNYRLKKVKRDKLFRVQSGQVRAILSKNYPTEYDSHFSIVSVVEELMKQPDQFTIEQVVQSNNLDEVRLSFRDYHSKDNDILGGLTVSNSEVGLASLTIEPFIEIKGGNEGIVKILRGGMNSAIRIPHRGSVIPTYDILSQLERLKEDLSIAMLTIVKEGNDNITISEARNILKKTSCTSHIKTYFEDLEQVQEFITKKEFLIKCLENLTSVPLFSEVYSSRILANELNMFSNTKAKITELYQQLDLDL